MLPKSQLLDEVIRVLVVDNQPFFREGIISWVARQKHLSCCGWADSADNAFELITSLAPQLVLLDLQLRAGDGLELLRRIQGIASKPRVIVVSQKDQTIFAERALTAGAMGYVLKAEESGILSKAIHTVLRGGLHLSPEMNRRIWNGRDAPLSSPPDRMRTLFNRELQVLESLGQGLTTKEIAEAFGISPKTVDSYRESLKKKLGVTDSVALIRMATIWQEEGRWGLPAAKSD